MPIIIKVTGYRAHEVGLVLNKTFCLFCAGPTYNFKTIVFQRLLVAQKMPQVYTLHTLSYSWL